MENIFLKQFTSDQITDTLRALSSAYFEKNMFCCFDGFELSTRNLEILGIKEVYKPYFVRFAQATHSGSQLYFYTRHGKNADEYPLVIEGDEGGLLVLAENLQQFLSFSSLSIIPFIDTLQEFKKFNFETIFADYLFSNADGRLNPYLDFLSQLKINKPAGIEEAIQKVVLPARNKFQLEINSYLL